MSWKFKCIIVIVVAIIVVMLLTYFIVSYFEERYLFQPFKEMAKPTDIPHEEHMIDGKLHAWSFNNHPGRPTVLFCHGNAGNLTFRTDIIGVAHSQRLNLLIFDYRGYGKSPGKPNKKGILEDGITAYKFLLERVHPTQIIIWGECLGSSVGTHIASQKPCRVLVLASPFSSIDDVFLTWHPSMPAKIVSKIFSWFTNRLNVAQWIKNVDCPVVIIHSTEDGIVPFKCAEKIYAAIRNPCRVLHPVKGSHFQPEIEPKVFRQLMEFCGVSAESCEEITETFRNWVPPEIYEPKNKS